MASRLLLFKQRKGFFHFARIAKMVDRNLLFGIMTVTGATLIHHTYGFLYATGALVPYLQSYFKLDSGQAMFFTSLLFACQAISTPIGAMSSKKMGFRWSTIISILMTSGGVFLSAYSVTQSYVRLLLTCSILFGLGIGASYSVLYAVATAWFPSRRSTVVGIIASGLGLGTVTIVPMQNAILNPKKKSNYSLPEITERLPMNFLCLGAYVLGLQIIGFCLLRKKHPEKVEVPIEPSSILKTDTTPETSKGKETVPAVHNYTIKEALKSIDFYLAFGLNFFNSASVGLISQTCPSFAKYSGYHSSIHIIFSLTGAFNCLGRLVWGCVGDRFSFKGPLIILQIEWALLWITYAYLPKIEGVAGEALFAIWSFLLYSCLGANFVFIPNIATLIFGPKNMPTIFGLMFAAMAPSNLMVTGILSAIDVDNSWKFIYGGGAVFAVIGLILVLFLRDQQIRCFPCANVFSKVCDCCRYVPEEEDISLSSSGKTEVASDNN